MTSTVPTIPNAIRGLLELCEQSDYQVDPTPQVSFGLPRNVENTLVIIGGGSGTEEWDAIGDGRRAEDYQIRFSVMTAIPGDTAIEAMERCWEIFTVISQGVREAARNRDPASGIQWGQVQAAEWETTVEDEGAGFVINATAGFNATT